MAEKLFWAVLKQLDDQLPEFVSGKAVKRFLRQFKRKIHLVDSTTIPLIASCMDWAKHRRRKAAAKCHLRLDLQSFLPRFAIMDTDKHADAKRAREVCAQSKPVKIVILEDYNHLADLATREVCLIMRAKDNMKYQVVHSEPQPPGSKVLRDEWIELENPLACQDYPAPMRRIVAQVEVDGKEVEMTFLSDHLEWSAQSIADLYCLKSIQTPLEFRAVLFDSLNTEQI